jgi:hypothetical protein
VALWPNVTQAHSRKKSFVLHMMKYSHSDITSDITHQKISEKSRHQGVAGL